VGENIGYFQAIEKCLKCLTSLDLLKNNTYTFLFWGQKALLWGYTTIIVFIR